MDALLLARIQFAFTVGFHFIFPPISIGLAWMLVLLEWRGWQRHDETAVQAGKWLGKLLAITFAVGVATGIVMEFQFGTNWAQYSKFVGDIFGAPLAAEGVFAFFLESTFLGVYLFARDRVAKWFHWFSILMVAVGSTLSAFWIIVANSWQQTPTAYTIVNGRAELTDFWEAVFNPSTLPRYFHVIVACLITGAFFCAGMAAWHLIKNPSAPFARTALKTSVVFGLIASVAAVMPTGHWHAIQVAQTQPSKFAAIEGLYETQSNPPMVVFGWPTDDPPTLHGAIEIPGLMPIFLQQDPSIEVPGLDKFPPEDRPPLWLPFMSFHAMVALGMWFILLMSLATLQLYRGKLWQDKRILRALLYSIPLPVVVCELGWIVAEVGRQPWVVYGLMRTKDGHSTTVGVAEVAFSLALFATIYAVLFALWLFLISKHGRAIPAAAGPAGLLASEASHPSSTLPPSEPREHDTVSVQHHSQRPGERDSDLPSVPSSRPPSRDVDADRPTRDSSPASSDPAPSAPRPSNPNTEVHK